jgi:hypothetical protein
MHRKSRHKRKGMNYRSDPTATFKKSQVVLYAVQQHKRRHLRRNPRNGSSTLGRQLAAFSTSRFPRAIQAARKTRSVTPSTCPVPHDHCDGHDEGIRRLPHHICVSRISLMMCPARCNACKDKITPVTGMSLV